jgi:hypothetical protein
MIPLILAVHEIIKVDWAASVCLCNVKSEEITLHFESDHTIQTPTQHSMVFSYDILLDCKGTVLPMYA